MDHRRKRSTSPWRHLLLHGLTFPIGALAILLLSRVIEDQTIVGFVGAGIATTPAVLDQLWRERRGDTEGNDAQQRGGRFVAPGTAGWVRIVDPAITIVHIILAIQIVQTFVGLISEIALRGAVSPPVAVEVGHWLVIMTSILLMVPITNLVAHRAHHAVWWLVTALAANFFVSWGVGLMLVAYFPQSSHFLHGGVIGQSAQLLGSLAIGAAIGLIWTRQTRQLEEESATVEGAVVKSPLHILTDNETIIGTASKAPLYALSVIFLATALLAGSLFVRGLLSTGLNDHVHTADRTVAWLLRQHIPPSIVDSCKRVPSHDPAAFLATEGCRFEGLRVEYSFAHAGRLMREHFREDLEEAQSQGNWKGNRTCEEGTPAVSEWSRTKDGDRLLGDDLDRPMGRMFCYMTGEEGRMVWEDYSLKILASAEWSGDEIDAVVADWKYHLGPRSPSELGGHGHT